MTRLVRSELLKVRTTRLLFWLGLLVALFETLLISLRISQDSLTSLSQPQNQRDIVSVAGVAVLISLILGIVASAGEYSHGTISHTFLVAPVRERVEGAKLVAAALAAAALTALAGVFAWLLTALLLSVRSLPDHLGSLSVSRPLFGALAAAALAGALGVGLGSLFRRQTGAIVFAFVWLLVGEPLLAIAGIQSYAPGHALAAVVEAGTPSTDLLGFWGGLALSLAYTAVFGIAGAIVAVRTDV